MTLRDELKDQMEKLASDAFDKGAISGVNALFKGIELLYSKSPNMPFREVMIYIKGIAELHKSKLEHEATR